jgi:hypothetical protein
MNDRVVAEQDLRPAAASAHAGAIGHDPTFGVRHSGQWRLDGSHRESEQEWRGEPGHRLVLESSKCQYTNVLATAARATDS